MTDRSVRWGRTCRAAAVVGVAAVTVPGLLSTAAFAKSSPTNATILGSVLAPLTGKVKAFKYPWGDPAADQVSSSGGEYRPEKDPGSLYTVTGAVGARSVWARRDAAGRPVTGAGVTVALLDSGLAPVTGLTGAGKVAVGPDLSLETNSPALRGLDTFGHGTHLGAIIGAADPGTVDPATGTVNGGSPGAQLGMAPGAGLLGLKLATANGSTDVSQVIAGLDWVSQHAHDPGLNVRVVNLSFGTGSLQPYQVDPLAAAAENAWRRGIVVVVSGGNEGPTAAGLTDPAIDPYVLAVGASDPELQVNGWKKPVMADFSSRGTTGRHVDLVAPGRSLTSLRDPGSYVDANHPEGMVAGDASGRLFRGSGTSQAAAVVSGAVALMLQANPALTPDQVKAALVYTAQPLRNAPVVDQGAGQLDVAAAVQASAPGLAQTVLSLTATQRFTRAAGTGSLEAARGDSHLVDPVDGSVLTGELDVQDKPFDGPTWAAASAGGKAWTGGSWNGAVWTGAAWAGGTSTDGWSGLRWSSTSWDGMRWSGMRWSGSDWDGTSWDGMRWSGMRWSGMRWSDGSWT